ncbi:serine/threonine protein kinase [bacterium]|nr:serine/threonine protein kinase [bacterium]MBU1025275.1 serine/threonine protein kinase [bacterium]
MYKQIGPYEIIHEIGRGGMGVLYLAKHPTLGIDVALKAMFPDPSREKDDPEIEKAKKRFQNEAKLIAQIDNPGIVKIYDFGTDDKTGALFIVMSYLNDGNLKEKIKEKRFFTFKETLKIIRIIAGAVEEIHKLGIIHRDLKPSNILFHNGRPVLTDFGIAKNVKDLVKTSTETGKMVGSIPYMSPERINDKHYDHRSDIFSFGIVVYEMLTGSNPFKADSAEASMNKITNFQPPFVNELNSGVPADFSRLLRKMLIKDPESRLSSLQAVLDYEPTVEKKITMAYPEPKPEKTNNFMKTLVTLVLLFLVGFAVFKYLPLFQGNDDPDNNQKSQTVVDSIARSNISLTHSEEHSATGNKGELQNEVDAVPMADNFKNMFDKGKSSLINEIEPNNIVDEANLLREKSKFSGILSAPDDKKDYWEIQIDEPFSVQIYWQILDGYPNGTIYLLNDSSETIDRKGVFLGDHEDNYFTMKQYLPPSTYFIGVNLSHQSCKYEIWFETTPLKLSEIEPNNISNEAIKMVDGAKYSGILTDHLDEKDFWSFSIRNTTEVKIYWHILDGYPNGTIYLLNDSSETIDRKGVFLGDHEDNYYIIKQFLNPGNYYVAVSTSSQSTYYEIWYETTS